MTIEAIQGALRPSLQLTWADDDGTPLDLSGATLTGVIRNKYTGVSRSVEGTLTVVTGPEGLFRWDYAAADVGDAGDFYIQFTATYGTGQSPARTKRTDWDVLEAMQVS